MNIVHEIRVPFRIVSDVTADQGLRIHLMTGEVYGSTALGDSVIGALLGYRRATRAADRYHDWKSSFVDSPHIGVSKPHWRRGVRPACLWTPVWLGAYVLLASISALGR